MKGMMNQAQLAERFGVTRSTLRRWLAAGKLPAPHAVLGQTKLWSEKRLTAWLSSQQSNILAEARVTGSHTRHSRLLEAGRAAVRAGKPNLTE